MNVVLQSLSKGTNRAGKPAHSQYVATFRIGGKTRRFHAIVEPREGNSVHFREPVIDNILAHNMDEGRKVYQAIYDLHLKRRPKLPMPLGDLRDIPLPEEQALAAR